MNRGERWSGLSSLIEPSHGDFRPLSRELRLCDWGDCDGLATMIRYDADMGWVLCCIECVAKPIAKEVELCSSCDVPHTHRQAYVRDAIWDTLERTKRVGLEINQVLRGCRTRQDATVVLAVVASALVEDDDLFDDVMTSMARASDKELARESQREKKGEKS